MQTTTIYAPILERLAGVEQRLKGVADLRFPFLQQLLEQVFETSGKRARPALTLLASNFHPHDHRTTETMAVAVELLHVATLIHDDTVDNSDLRRGKATISSPWGRNVAVLVGDYIFATSATLVCDTGNIRVIRRFSETIMELSSGELQEIADAYNADQTMEAYLRRIYDKTASLFTTAGQSGAVLSGAPEDIVGILKEYSYNLGIAFQIVDDILDFEGTQEEVGKPVGGDLSRGVVTLPALIAMERYPEGSPISEVLRHPGDPARLKRAVELIQDSSVIADSYKIAEKYCGRAAEALRALPENPSRISLEELISYVLTRRW